MSLDRRPSEGHRTEPAGTSAAAPARWRGVARTLSVFFLGQGALQGTNVLIGLLLVRLLSIRAYAQYGLAYGFQTTANTLMDLGFASTIIPLIGSRHQDRKLAGLYVVAASRLRRRSFLLLAPFVVAAFLVVARRHDWSLSLQLALMGSVLLGLYSSGTIACFSAPFFLFRRLEQYFGWQTLSNLGRLAGYAALEALGWLNAWTASLLTALNTATAGRILVRKSRRLVDLEHVETGGAEREILYYIRPAMPPLIFSALQSQISLFLVGVFGQTVSIAEVAALGRITQLFLVLQSFNLVVVEPYMARIGGERLLRTYLGLLLAASACLVPVVALAFFYPAPVVWLLGSKYAGLRPYVGWMVLSCCMNYVSGLAWIMNRARRWIFWSGSVLEIVSLLGVQAGFLLLVGVRTTRDAVLFNIASSFCYVLAHGYTAVYGFLHGARAVPDAGMAGPPAGEAY